jgi:dihydropteroate synthase
MGIVNVTPDSFSDGGHYYQKTAAIDRVRQLAEDGADVLDIGGESTRPYSEPTADDEEMRRVIPVIEAARKQTDLPISVDTSKAIVAREAIRAGAEIINDVTGFEGDPEMVSTAVESRAGLCVMHMQGTPQTMQDNPTYGDVVTDVYSYLESRRDALLARGVLQSRICLDPGIGFGKTHQHNLDILAACQKYHELGCPLMVGHSHKGFLAKVLGDKTADRTAATIGVSLSIAGQGVQVIRVHDVRPVREALLLFAASGGIDGKPTQL